MRSSFFIIILPHKPSLPGIPLFGTSLPFCPVAYRHSRAIGARAAPRPTTKRDICSSKEDRFETTGCSQAVYETSLSTGCFLYPTRLEIFRCKRLKTESPHSLSDCEPLSNVWRCVELRR